MPNKLLYFDANSLRPNADSRAASQAAISGYGCAAILADAAQLEINCFFSTSILTILVLPPSDMPERFLVQLLFGRVRKRFVPLQDRIHVSDRICAHEPELPPRHSEISQVSQMRSSQKMKHLKFVRFRSVAPSRNLKLSEYRLPHLQA